MTIDNNIKSRNEINGTLLSIKAQRVTNNSI